VHLWTICTVKFDTSLYLSVFRLFPLIRPGEYKKRGGGWMLIAGGMLVNAEVPENLFVFWTDRNAFIQIVEEALRK